MISGLMKFSSGINPIITLGKVGIGCSKTPLYLLFPLLTTNSSDSHAGSLV